MKNILAAFALVACLGAPALALTQDTRIFLRSLGFAADSPDVLSAEKDVIAGTSLDTLAAKHDEVDVKRFIATRFFIHTYMTDTKTPFPSIDLYYVDYLTQTEQDFVFRQISMPFFN